MNQRQPCAIVLAAGDGSRMRSVAPVIDGIAVPKQFCSVDGHYTLLESAIARARRCAGRVLVVVSEHHRRFWESELRGHHPDDVIVQPTNRGTGVGVLLPVLHAFSWSATSPIIAFPADHHVEDEDVLAAAVDRALLAVNATDIVLLGMQPDASECANGWIMPANIDEGDVRRVAGFTDKVDEPTAEELRAAGGLWNSFMFAASSQALLGLFHHSAGWLLRAFLDAAAINASEPHLAHLYASVPPCDFFRDILARTPEMARVTSVPPCGFTDVGLPTKTTLQCVGRMAPSHPGHGHRRPAMLGAMRREALAPREGHA